MSTTQRKTAPLGNVFDLSSNGTGKRGSEPGTFRSLTENHPALPCAPTVEVDVCSVNRIAGRWNPADSETRRRATIRVPRR